MRTPLLTLVLILPNALVLAGAINAQAAQVHQTAPQRNATSRSKAIAAEVRKDERFVSFLLRKENRAIGAQERSLRDLGRLEARLRDLTRRLERAPRSHGLSKLINATRRGINELVRAIQWRESQILDGFVQEDRVLKRIEQIAPQAAGLRVLLQRMAVELRAIEREARLQATLGVPPLPRTTPPAPTFPPGKPPASPVQA